MRTMKIMKTIVVILLISLVLGAYFLVGSNGDSSEPQTFVTIESRQLVDVLNTVGQVFPAKKILLKSESSGKISKLFYKEGSKVLVGDTILTIDPSLLLNRKKYLALSIKKRSLTLKHKKELWKNGSELFKKGGIPRKDLLLLEYSKNMEELEFQQEQLEYDKISEQLKKTIITSPIDGIITNLEVSEGEVIASAVDGNQNESAIATLIDISLLEVQTEIPESYYSQINVKDTVYIIPESDSEQSITGIVGFKASNAKRKQYETMGSFSVRIELLDSLLDVRILPGISVRVSFPLLDEVVDKTLPCDLIRYENEKPYVYLINAESEYNEKKWIHIGKTDYNYCEITHGLSKSDKVSDQ